MDSAAQPEKAPAITLTEFGVVDGKPVQLFTLTNKNGLVLKVTNYGAIITEFDVPDKAGKLADIVLGFSDVDGYVKGSPYFGATVGRVANRIKNATFDLEGKHYKLDANNAPLTTSTAGKRLGQGALGGDAERDPNAVRSSS